VASRITFLGAGRLGGYLDGKRLLGIRVGRGEPSDNLGRRAQMLVWDR